MQGGKVNFDSQSTVSNLCWFWSCGKIEHSMGQDEAAPESRHREKAASVLVAPFKDMLPVTHFPQ